MAGVASAERRQEIVEVAAAEFAERGFERASLNRILAAVNLSKGSMYHHFDSKAELFALVVSDVIDRVRLQVGTPPTDFDDLARFRIGFFEWYRRLLGYLAAHPSEDSLLEVLRAAIAAPDPPPPLQRCAAEIESWYIALFGQLAQIGALRDDIPGEVLAGATERATLAIDRWFIDQIRSQPERLDELAHAGTELFVRLVT